MIDKILGIYLMIWGLVFFIKPQILSARLGKKSKRKVLFTLLIMWFTLVLPLLFRAISLLQVKFFLKLVFYIVGIVLTWRLISLLKGKAYQGIELLLSKVPVGLLRLMSAAVFLFGFYLFRLKQ